MKVVLVRERETKFSTLGRLIVPDVLVQIFTLEDVWMGNKVGDGRIPAGVYKCTPHGWNGEPVKFEKVWKLEDKAPRSDVVLHWGNTNKDTRGCPLVGLRRQDDFLGESMKAVNILRSSIGKRAFTLEIIDAFGN